MFSLIKQVFIVSFSFCEFLARVAKISDRAKCLFSSGELYG